MKKSSDFWTVVDRIGSLGARFAVVFLAVGLIFVSFRFITDQIEHVLYALWPDTWYLSIVETLGPIISTAIYFYAFYRIAFIRR
jgi:hypothetical protein